MNRKRQQGASLIGMLLWGVVIVFAAVLVMNLVPGYVEYFTIKKILVDIGQEPQLDSMSNAAIRDKFDHRAMIDTIHSVKSIDLDISKNNGMTVISVDYPYQVKLVGNISLVVDFHATSNSPESRVRQQVQLVE
jgi:hypothetical protein